MKNFLTILLSMAWGVVSFIIGFLMFYDKPEPTIIVKPIYIYRDTCDSQFMNKICQIESGCLDSISGENGMGIGRFGIYEICLIGSGLDVLLNMKHEDMYTRKNSEAVFWAMMGIFQYQHWQKYGKPASYEELARKWAGGPDGERKDATLRYLRAFMKN